MLLKTGACKNTVKTCHRHIRRKTGLSAGHISLILLLFAVISGAEWFWREKILNAEDIWPEIAAGCHCGGCCGAANRKDYRPVWRGRAVWSQQNDSRRF